MRPLNPGQIITQSPGVAKLPGRNTELCPGDDHRTGSLE